MGGGGCGYFRVDGSNGVFFIFYWILALIYSVKYAKIDTEMREHKIGTQEYEGYVV